MQIQKSVKKMIGNGRAWLAGATASLVPMVYSAAAHAQTSTISDLGDSAKTELDKVLPIIVTVGGSIVLIAAAVCGVMIILRVTKRA